MKESASRLEPAAPAGHLTVEAAAMRLGLDPFTIYNFVWSAETVGKFLWFGELS
jgi:hypothetical protein